MDRGCKSPCGTLATGLYRLPLKRAKLIHSYLLEKGQGCAANHFRFGHQKAFLKGSLHPEGVVALRVKEPNRTLPFA